MKAPSSARIRRGAHAAFLAAPLLAAAGYGPAAQADPFHYRNLMVGDRATGFGGAYAALSDDTAGLFYNPAGTPYSTELASATVNVLSQSRVRYDDFFPDGGALESKSSGLVPSYFGILRHVGAYTLGFSIAVTDFISERELDEASFTTGGATVNEYLTGDSDVRLYNVGPSLALALGDGWSAGITLYGSYRDLREARTIGGDAERAAAEGDGSERLVVETSYRIEDTQFGLRPLLGLQYRRPRFAAGLTLSRDFGLRRSYDYFYRSTRNQTLETGEGSEPEEVLDIAGRSSASTRQRYPWQLGAGFAWTASPQLQLAAQVDHYFAVDQRVVAGDDANSPPLTRQLRAVTNFSLGGEYRFSQRVAMRLAVFSDGANARVADAGPFERREQIDLIGGAIAGSYRDSVREYKLGLYFSSGSGHGTLGDLGELNFSGDSVLDAHSRSLVLLFGAEL